MQKRVLVEIEDRIARVTLNRPEKHNALDRDMFTALIAAGESLMANRAIRAVVLCGAGENFCAGIDVAVFSGSETPVFDADDMRPRRNSAANFFQTAALVWRQLPMPVIAAIKGKVFGAGLQIALGADLRLATADSRWSVMEIRWGIIPDMGISVTAAGVLPADRLKRLAFTGAVVTGADAQGYGLVTEIHERPLDAALGLARDLAERSPDALRALKELINAAPGLGAGEALGREAALQASLLGSANQREAVAANVAGRPPKFADPGQ